LEKVVNGQRGTIERFRKSQKWKGKGHERRKIKNASRGRSSDAKKC